MSDITSLSPDHGQPADGELEQGGMEPLGRPGIRHWRQATITNTSLADQGSVYFAAIEMTRMPMILTDPRQEDCPIVFANNAFLDLTGYEVEEVIGRNCRFLQGAGTDRASVQQMRDAITARDAIALEILNYRRDGSPFWNAIFLGPVFDEQGVLLFFFASQLDVSKRRESEQALRQAQKMEAIGQLTAGLGHDFNNLLHIVNGSLERMKDCRHDEAAFERYHAAATAASERSAKLTQQLLAFARRTRLEPEGVNLTDLIQGFAELLDTSVGKKATLHLSLQRRLPLTRVDPTYLEMALLNVVLNARDASPDGGDITISTRQLSLRHGDALATHLKPGDYVVLCVRDEGAGMPAHVLARATEPFFTTKGLGHGTGLGLAMAQGFAEQSKGRLDLESEEGRGTTVRMYFPRFEEREELPQVEAASSVEGYHPKPLDPTAPPLILVVDDHHDIAELAREALSDLGYRVVVAHSADEALARFEEAQARLDAFQLVFTDVLMPGGDNGLVLAERLRVRDPATPILLTTGYSDEMAMDGPAGVGLDVLGKPYKRNELIDRVQTALRRGARTGPGRRPSDFGHAEA